MLLCVSGNIFSVTHTGNNGDWLLEKLFGYKETVMAANDTTVRQIYLKHTFKSLRRNPTLFLVPTMYSIAKGKRDYIRETYGIAHICGAEIVDYDPRLITGTIRKNRQAMPIVINYVMPDLYSELLFGDNVLSPFHKDNARFYEYNWSPHSDSTAMLIFNSMIDNTQLVDGWATVDNKSGRIVRCLIKGAFDMLEYTVNVDMGAKESVQCLVPQTCNINTLFSFMGNKIEYELNALYTDCNVNLPDTLITDRKIMEAYRPLPLDDIETQIYRLHEYEKKNIGNRDTMVIKKEKDLAEKTYDIIEDNLLSSIRAKTDHASLRISPLLDPLQLSYSNRRGLSYRMKIDARYDFTSDRYITLRPRIGYNFKINKMFYSAPLKYTISEKKNNWIELQFANGNRITNSSVLDELEGNKMDTVNFDDMNLDYFNDQHMKLRTNIALTKNIDITVGCTYHNREAVNKPVLQAMGKPTSYKSFAPLITIGYRPLPSWPLFTINYERSIKDILKSNIEYERWEFDTSYKRDLGRLRKVNIRLGGGLYTNKNSNYFVDFENFHEEYLPEGWDDEWTGNFQLLNSDWYNASEYYLRMNASYESPLMLVSRIPLIGKYVETERLYASVLNIQHTRPYFEIGYGFTNRYFSIGAFGSFLNGNFQEFGCKFTFEMFSRW